MVEPQYHPGHEWTQNVWWDHPERRMSLKILQHGYQKKVFLQDNNITDTSMQALQDYDSNVADNADDRYIAVEDEELYPEREQAPEWRNIALKSL